MECAFMNEFFDSDRVKVETLLDQPISQEFGRFVLYIWLLTILVGITYLSPTLAFCGFLYTLNMEENNNYFSAFLFAEHQKQNQPAYSRLDYEDDEDEDSDSVEDDDDDANHHLMIQHRSKKDHGDVLNAVHTHRINMKDISTTMKNA